MIPRTLWAAQFVIMAAVFCVAQSPQPNMAPNEVNLSIGTADKRVHFFLGEPIALEVSYSAASRRYLYVSNPKKLVGGRSLQIECAPPVESVFDTARTRDAQGSRFQQMLIDPVCMGAGIGGSIGGACGDGDCDWEQPLGNSPLRFGSGNLNQYLRFRSSGTYSCRATSAQITTAPKDESDRPALSLQSNLLTITLTDDPAWARAEALALGATYKTDCRDVGAQDKRLRHCADLATKLTYLDSPDALAVKVRFFDGINHGWDNGFWDSISNTSYPDQAVKLMSGRIQAPDVAVSSSVLFWLAASAMKSANPDAFQPGAVPGLYYAQATEHLREFVRLVGTSLASKNADTLPESLKTYQGLADRLSCNGETLIPDGERKAVLDAITQAETSHAQAPNR